LLTPKPSSLFGRCCRCLCERDRRTVYLRFFQDWTQMSIAREVGVTHMQASPLIKRMLHNMRMQHSARDDTFVA
jgi:DNA-directed RNA polymerase specialized sigma subunit